MIQYSLVFLGTWAVLLIIWITFGVPIGPDAPLEYVSLFMQN